MSTKEINLFKYQEQSVVFALATLRALLRLDTGLGKTLVTIETIKRLKLKRPVKVLVILPAFLKHNWKKEISKWEGRETYYNQKIEWVLVSYTYLALKDNHKKYLEGKFDVVVCDECHYLKNWGAKRTKIVVKYILPKIKRVLLLSATPYVKSSADLHPLFSTCEPGKWGTIGEFEKKYCLKRYNPYLRCGNKWEYYGSNPKTSKELGKDAKRFMISFKKSKVLKDLPPKIETDVEVDLPAQYHTDPDDYETYIDIDTGKIRGGLYEVLAKQSVEIGLAKLPTFFEWLETLDPHQPLVIFCKHHKVVDELQKIISEKYDSKCAVITGKVKMKDRDKIVDKFQAGKIKHLIATMASCGVGINLTAASIAAFVELPWDYAELKQCEDRLHRIGQKNCVNIYRFSASNTVDDIFINVLNRKIKGEGLTIGNY